MKPISEDAVRATAYVIGDHSAAANALKEAEERKARGEEVRFFFARGCIIVRGRATKEV